MICIVHLWTLSAVCKVQTLLQQANVLSEVVALVMYWDTTPPRGRTQLPALLTRETSPTTDDVQQLYQTLCPDMRHDVC